MSRRILLLLLAAMVCFAQHSQTNSQPETFAAKIAGLQKIDGYLPLYWDEHTGKMWLEIDRFNQEFLYVTALSAGIGFTDGSVSGLGPDRGKMNEPEVVQFTRSGPRVLLVESNYGFRASSSNEPEQRAVRDSFARSTLWGFDVAAEENGRVLVDATNFLLRDAAHVAEELQAQKQGAYKLDPTRCAFELSLTKGFPRNTEIETTITFTGEPAGRFIRLVTPSPDAVTVREHQGFAALPEPGFKVRMQDPRAGYFAIDFMDFSSPVDEPVIRRYTVRHRLEKKDPAAALSDPVEPIVYYIDSGVPEPVRSALMEGASWWNQAFEAAGYRNAFQVKLLPPNVDPMDVRYNVVQWVNRSSRSWSYGQSLTDPRTGEIIKGIVSLGSLRMHQDYVIFEGLMAPYAPGHDLTGVLKDAVYARLRQLAAHEIGHTLGLEHNYIASTQGRASVMDYPAPLVELRADNTLNLSNAYAAGIGDWDKVAIRWGYSQFPPGTDEHAELDKILMDAAHRGLTFITDADSRPPGSAHPKSHLWDNGPNAVDELNRIMKIRAIALSRFGQNNIRPGTPMATLDEVLVPLYFLHRYQTEAASKVLGGNEYTFALRGDGQPITHIVAAAEQRRALKALLATIDPANLTVPERVLNLIPPRPSGYPRSRETFPNRTGVTFDPVSGAEAAADLTVSLILNPERAARLVEYHARNAQNPGLEEVIETLAAATLHAKPGLGLKAQVAAVINHVVLVRMLGLAVDSSASPEVLNVTMLEIRKLKSYLTSPYDLELLAQFERDPKLLELPKPVEMPPGQPIGEEGDGLPW